ncbi:MAG: RagB/SusD family nutrient uptake outer membrane protein [Breznakibacter sp.]
MKKYTLLILPFVIWGLASCVSLEEDPGSLLTTNQFYKKDADAVAAVNGIYNAVNSTQHTLYNRLIQISTEMATDDYEAGPRARNAHVRAISGLTHDASNDRMQEIWRQSYDAINRANVAIDNIDGNPAITASLAERLEGEAKFLRALNYFNLVRWFGGVPLILHETSSLTADNLYVAKSTEAEVYDQIEKDLQDAENLLPLPGTYTGSDVGRASKGAAGSLLSKVYLTQKKWELAASKSFDVIDAQWYELFDDFADVFALSAKNGKEHIFSAQFKGNSNWNGNMLGGSSATTDVPGINGDYADALHAEGGLYQSFSDNDKRKAVTFVTQMVSPTNGQTYTIKPHFYKYYDETTVGSPYQSSKNTPIIRYAEVLLIYAEALNEANDGPTDQAYWAIDEVRNRAGITRLKDTSPALSVDQFRDSVFQERRKELVFEYQRWFDLARRGADYYVATLKAAGKTAAQPRHIHFPTPQRELDLNPKLEQHPDWAD